jgi:NTE family protein
MQNSSDLAARAVILGGGGITGIAWEIGVICGLRDRDVDLSTADALIGTSAGAFAATEIASGVDLETRYREQFEEATHEIAATMSAETQAAYGEAIKAGYPDRQKIAKLFGQLAMRSQTVSTEARASVVCARLPITEWPSAPLGFTAIDAETGELHVLNKASGLTLVEAASASGAVPGLWPAVHAGGRWWIDGGMVSVANVELGAAYKRVVVIAPVVAGLPGLPTVDDHVATLKQDGVRVALISPNDQTREAIGANPFDPTRRGAAAEAGRAQGRDGADDVRAVWTGP